MAYKLISLKMHLTLLPCFRITFTSLMFLTVQIYMYILITTEFILNLHILCLKLLTAYNARLQYQYLVNTSYNLIQDIFKFYVSLIIYFQSPINYLNTNILVKINLK